MFGEEQANERTARKIEFEILTSLAGFSERQIEKRTGVHRNTIRLIRHGKGVKRSTYEKVIHFLRENAPPVAQA